MIRRAIIFSILAIVLLALCSPGVLAVSREGRSNGETGRILMTGYILDNHRSPVRGALIRVRIDGEPKEILVHGKSAPEVRSSAQGIFLMEMRVPESFVPRSRVALEIGKTGFRISNRVFYPSDFVSRDGNYLIEETITLQQNIGPAFWISTLVLLGIYVLISFDLLHRTIAAMLGAAVVLTVTGTIGTFFPAYQIISFETAVRKIDMNVIFLLLGMMIIVGILKKTGVFQWFAAVCFKLARGRVLVLALMLTLLSALVSAFLDNVTTMLLIAPVSIEIALALRISPPSLLIPEVLASNVGGAATLIGDPPNIMIGSYAGLTFMDFLANLALICFLVVLALFIVSKIVYGRDYGRALIGEREAFIRELESRYRITDRTLLLYALLVLALVIVLFISHGVFHMEVSVGAIAGASVLSAVALVTRKVNLTEMIPGTEGHVLWWALALGACLGGNGTLIGASANVVTMGIAEKAGYPIRFGSFMKVGFVFMTVSVGLANIWLLVFY